MEYNFLDNSVDRESVTLPQSDKINDFLLKNNSAEIVKGIEFLGTDEKFLYVHGFLGTGKRQVLNYITEFLDKDVIKLEYYCKQSTVCDDILLSFIDKIEKSPLAKLVSFNRKVLTLVNKFEQYISSIKKPFIIVLHSTDDILEENYALIQKEICQLLSHENLKIIISTKGMNQEILGDVKYDRKLFIKGFSKEIFKEYLDSNKIECNDKFLDEFYQCTRGYYYYTALVIKIMQAMELSVSEFIDKFKLSGMSFDTYIGVTYLNLVPQAIRNFFWFIRSVRHGLTLNALAVYDLYDEFSVSYLKANLMVFEADETLYVQDYFQQDIDISIPAKTELKLHKYIITIYEKELKESLNNRAILLSRQAMRAEIEYHTKCIENISNNSANDEQKQEKIPPEKVKDKEGSINKPKLESGLKEKIEEAEKYYEQEDYTKSIELYKNIIDNEALNSRTLAEIRQKLAFLYRKIEDFESSQHYYELVEKFYSFNKETINLNYLYYEMTKLYFQMYKIERSIETIKKVIYSVDTPQSLLVDSCTLLGNIYSDTDNYEEAYSYYQKALDSLDNEVSTETLAELYFKFALANDEKGDSNMAFEYYNKCLSLGESKYKSPAYSNLGSCYFENGNYTDAENCFLKSYDIEKSANNYDGIYYTASNLAQIYKIEKSSQALNYLIEAKQAAEFVNENSYIIDSSLELGDFYYNLPDKKTEALEEYFNALKFADNTLNETETNKITKRIEDMKLRMEQTDFERIEKKFNK